MALYQSDAKTREEAISGVMKNSEQIATEPIQIYLLNTVKEDLNEDGQVRRYTFGRKNPEKQNRTIMMVGETGTGKSTLINMMVNYMLGVKWDDNIRFQIIPGEGERSKAKSQTSVITVYEIFGLEKLSVPFSLTVIDTPGYEDTRDTEKDKITAQNLYTLLNSLRGVEQIDAVCFVVKASLNLLTPHQKYIFDAILSLFGKNMEKHIVTLITFSSWTPPSEALQTLIQSGVPFLKDDNDEPVYFPFNNLPLEKPGEKYEMTYKTSWDKGTKSFKDFFKVLGRMEPQSLRMTEKVLKRRQSLDNSVQRLGSQIKDVEEKHKALDEEAIMQTVQGNATCCTVCKVNCHYPGCWWAKSLRWCSVMKDGKCTVCPKNCSYEVHKKENRIYQPDVSKLQQDLKNTEAEKTKLIERCFQTILHLKKLAMKFDSDSTHRNILSLIEMLKNNNETEKVEELQKMLEKTM